MHAILCATRNEVASIYSVFVCKDDTSHLDSFDTVQFIHFVAKSPDGDSLLNFCTVEGISFDKRIAIPF